MSAALALDFKPCACHGEKPCRETFRRLRLCGPLCCRCGLKEVTKPGQICSDCMLKDDLTIEEKSA
jgi:hypothetical protein